MYQSVIKKEGSGVGASLRAAADASLAEDYVSPPKYKSSLLHRYLNDSLRHVMVANGVTDARRRNHSGSFSSNEYDEDLLSPSCSETEANFVYRTGKTSSHMFSRCGCVEVRCDCGTSAVCVVSVLYGSKVATDVVVLFSCYHSPSLETKQTEISI